MGSHLLLSCTEGADTQEQPCQALLPLLMDTTRCPVKQEDVVRKNTPPKYAPNPSLVPQLAVHS